MTFDDGIAIPATAAPIALELADRLAAIELTAVPASARRAAIDDLIDMAGLCVAARRGGYLAELLAGWDGVGDVTAIGQSRPLDAAGAALVNGVATHGEDFDDTLEGAPIRVAAMVIPAVLAAAERYGRSGADALRGIVLGLETICRLNLVSPGAIHRAGFHPVGVLGALGAAAGASGALGHSAAQLADALAIAGSFSSGTLAYLDDGAWTKRLHPGWAAQSGLRAAVLAMTGFVAPRRFLESDHGFFRAFAPGAPRHFDAMLDGIGQEWRLERIAFKPYPCGTMIHPYIDCMRRLAADGVRAHDVVDIECETGEGLVDRLWEPLAVKHRPPSGYAAKFSMPYCMAVALIDGDVGLAQFTDDRASDPAVLALAARIRYVIDPDNEYPANYSGHVRAVLRDGTVRELRQPHLRGGAREPLSRAELVGKFRANVRYGGWPPSLGEALLTFCLGVDAAPDLSGLQAFRV
jgi:2-methylcitrate dehydratase PrpD